MSFLLRKDEPPVNHPLFTGEVPVAMLSAEAPKYPSAVNTPDPHESMAHELRQRGYKFDSTHGKYEKPERSFIIYNPKMHDLFDLSKKYGQESFVYSSGGDKKLIYANGPHENKFHPSTPDVTISPTAPDDYYTYVPHVGYVTLGFDFNKVHPLEHQESSAGGHTMGKSEIDAQLKDFASVLRKNLEDNGFLEPKSFTPQEAVQEIGKLVKSRIEQYQAELVELRKREESSVGRGPHEESSVGVLPSDKPSKVIPSPGSGGPIKKSNGIPGKKCSGCGMPKAMCKCMGKAEVPTAKPPTAPPTPAKPPASTPKPPTPAAPAAPVKPAGAPAGTAMGKSLFNVKAEANPMGAAKPRPGIFGKMK